MSTKRDKTTGLPLPSPVNPGSTVCVMITIPNASEYRQALRGVLSDLGKWWNWSHTVGQSNEPALQAAELWRAAAQTMVYTDECGLIPMSCEDVANCIETDDATRAAINQIAGRSSQPGTTSTPGERMSDTNWAANLTETDDCDIDAFWAQCEQFTDYLVTAGSDFLEQIEVYSNAVEAAQFIEMAPFIGTIVDEVQIDKAIEFIDWVAEVFAEFYEGADTQPNRTAIACALFCSGRANCALSLEGAFGVINARAGNIFTPGSLDSMEALINSARTIVTNPALPLDVWVAFVLGFARVAGYLGVRGIDATLNIVLKAAINDANDDWMLLCEDCPDYCGPAWPAITWNDGNQTGQSGMLYTVQSEQDPGAPQYTTIRNTEYGDWGKGNYILKGIELLSSGGVERIYIERDNAVVFYDGSDFSAVNTMLVTQAPCVRFIAVYRPITEGSFSVRFTIDNGGS